MGRRLGPNKVSCGGMLQPIADALKLINKRVNNLYLFSKWTYYIRTIIIITLTLILWRRIVENPTNLSLKFTILIIIVILRINTIKIIFRGWRTYTKYPLLGSLRTVRQIISYESIIFICIIAVVLLNNQFRLITGPQEKIIISVRIPFIILIWIPRMLAELNRTPYDFREGERELVRGFNTEFGSGRFTLIFLREYRNIIFIRTITTILFFNLKEEIINAIIILRILFLIIWVRATLPRYRFDKLISIAWKTLIPIITLFLIILSTL